MIVMKNGTPSRKTLLVVPMREYRYLDEALTLAETAGYDVVAVYRSRYPRTVRRGLLERLKDESRTLGADALLFYGDLQPSSAFKIMKETRLRVIDRVTLILEIFALHASSREALLQIEMAKIRHEIPMVREIIRRKKLGEDPGFLGPGMYAADQYLRHLTRRLSKIRSELDKLRRSREARLESRRRSGALHVSIVGYASAGKTSLFNALTGEKRPVGPEYFTTLHPKHKGVTIKGHRLVFADTVGFIRKVPPEIIEAFHATLSEIRYSDAIIFVIDVSETASDLKEKLEAGMETLARIGALGMPMIIAANKIDSVRDELHERLSILEEEALSLPGQPPVVPVSAVSREGLDLLVDAVLARIKSGRRISASGGVH